MSAGVVAQLAEPLSEPFDLRATIRSIAGRFEATARAKGLSFDVKTGNTVPVIAIGDEAVLAEVLAALIDNAVTFTSAGEVVASISCDAAIAGRTLVHVEISDTGEGMSDEVLGELFDSSDSTGGLARSRRLVELMDGSFGASSVVGVGTTVWLTVPLDVCAPAA